MLLDEAGRRLVEREFRWAFLWVLRENMDARRFYEFTRMVPCGRGVGGGA